jgi:hypothetical protein
MTRRTTTTTTDVRHPSRARATGRPATTEPRAGTKGRKGDATDRPSRPASNRGGRTATRVAGLSPYERFVLIADGVGLLPEWTLTDEGETADSDSAAHVTPLDDYHSAGFAHSRHGWPTDPTEQRRILYHEAAHLLLADLTHAGEAAAAALAEPAQGLARAHLRRQEELLADRLARLLDPTTEDDER